MKRKRRNEDWFTVAEVADLLRVSERSVRRWIQNGKLKFYKIGRAIRISEDQIRDFLQR